MLIRCSRIIRVEKHASILAILLGKQTATSQIRLNVGTGSGSALEYGFSFSSDDDMYRDLMSMAAVSE